jgi:hypothetical protein
MMKEDDALLPVLPDKDNGSSALLSRGFFSGGDDTLWVLFGFFAAP